MDEFGVLVESIGFKAHGKSSAPLADLKSTNKTNAYIGINQSNSNSNFDGLFGSSSTKPTNNPLDDDVFDSVFRVSSSNFHDDDDDVFGLMKTSAGSSASYDVLGNKVSPVMKTSTVDDLLGSFGGMGVKAAAAAEEDLTGYVKVKTSGLKKHSVKKQETGADLLSDFGVSFNGRKSEAKPTGQSAKSFSASAQDPFLMFETTQGSSYSGASVVDDYLDSLFTSGTQSNVKSSHTATTEDSVYDALFSNNVDSTQHKKTSFERPNKAKPASSKANSTDDFSYLFGMGVAPPSVGFQEIQGESEERRKARFNHHMTTQERMINALNEKNKRDLREQQEQDEKHRVAATLDGDIKRWAVGKEGNLRALLSSLQHVLWAGSGWQPISLTDLITSTAVKKAYHKATLCVHPDKVQQKGASVEQKYIAEKVFDLLKESWNKFNAEEFKKC
ncbi:hypothetical protein QVD17_39564 [Tagetes erecta]|uniref:Uncharacterized protein n=1 Tax=Tagetes erecta TaxID=13708 RepID=A0AAD8JSM5_TARER|nr:hypothetical protein QVD17_39564 [Tagetes erecta]